MKPVKFLQSAREDIRREKSYYRAIDPALARRFQSAVEAATEAASDQPLAMQALEYEVRRWPLETFRMACSTAIKTNSYLFLQPYFIRANHRKGGENERVRNEALLGTSKALSCFGFPPAYGAPELRRCAAVGLFVLARPWCERTAAAFSSDAGLFVLGLRYFGNRAAAFLSWSLPASKHQR